MPGDGLGSWDYVGLALHFYKAYYYDFGSKQQTIFFEVIEQIIKIVEMEFATGNLDKTGIWFWCTLKSGKLWPLSKWIKINTTSAKESGCRFSTYAVSGKNDRYCNAHVTKCVEKTVSLPCVVRSNKKIEFNCNTLVKCKDGTRRFHFANSKPECGGS